MGFLFAGCAGSPEFKEDVKTPERYQDAITDQVGDLLPAPENCINCSQRASYEGTTIFSFDDGQTVDEVGSIFVMYVDFTKATWVSRTFSKTYDHTFSGSGSYNELGLLSGTVRYGALQADISGIIGAEAAIGLWANDDKTFTGGFKATYEPNLGLGR